MRRCCCRKLVSGFSCSVVSASCAATTAANDTKQNCATCTNILVLACCQMTSDTLKNNGFLLSVLVNHDSDYAHTRKQYHSQHKIRRHAATDCSPCTQLQHHNPTFTDSYSKLNPSILVTPRPSQHLHSLTINTSITEETSRSSRTHTTPHSPTVSNPWEPAKAATRLVKLHPNLHIVIFAAALRVSCQHIWKGVTWPRNPTN